MQQQWSDQELVDGILRGNPTHQMALYRQYNVPMFRILLRYARDRAEAEDMMQDAFIRVYRDMGQFRGDGALGGWIRRIMVNASIDFYRKSIRHRTEDMECAYAESAEGEDAISMCSAEEIMKAVQTLPPSYRAVFNLYAIEGYSHKEIGDLLNITESTSRSNLVKARGKLQEMLAHLNKVRR